MAVLALVHVTYLSTFAPPGPFKTFDSPVNTGFLRLITQSLRAWAQTKQNACGNVLNLSRYSLSATEHKAYRLAFPDANSPVSVQKSMLPERKQRPSGQIGAPGAPEADDQDAS